MDFAQPQAGRIAYVLLLLLCLNEMTYDVEYVQIKPLLVVATVILKATGTYKEGSFAADSGYTYISVVYNLSICLSL